jgi:hypothetical protein
MKKSLKIAATINLVIALLSFIFTGNIIYPILLSTLSLIHFNYTTKTIPHIYNSKTLITIISLFNFFMNPISGIILLVGQDKLYQEYKNSKEKEEIKELSSEEKKISLLLNLGVGLVSLSGIILISTNWHIITDEIKLLILVLVALLFLGLSKLSENKLKIEILEKNYWLLSMLFIILTILGVGYFQTISQWFSFYGEGKYLYLASTSIMISLLSFITNDKYKNPLYSNICYIGIIGSIISILLQLKLEIEIILILINIILIPLNIIKNKTLENNKELIKYITIAFTVINLAALIETQNIIYVIIIAILNIINTIIISIKEGNIEGIYASLVINASIITTLIRTPIETNITIQTTSIIGTIIYSIMYLLNIFTKETINKTLIKVMNIITNLAMLALIIINIENKIELTIITSLIVLTSLIINYKKIIKYENILLPIKIMFLIISIIILLQDIINLEISYIMIIIYLIAFIIYKLTKEKLKTTSLVLYYIFFALALLVNDNHQIIPSIINIASAGTVFLLTQQESKTKEKISYIALLITILSVLSYTNILETTQLNNGIIILLIYMILTIATRDNKNISKINYLSIILPLMVIISDNDIPFEIIKITENLIGMYAMTIISILLLKNDKDRNILMTLLSILLLWSIMFIESWMIGLYVGIVALTLIVIGFIKKEYKGLFIEGIIITIINILYQFKYILQELPLWIYTLLAGLTIIGLVTYKVIKDKE